MSIWMQKSASIQLQTSSLKLAAQPAISCAYTSYRAPSLAAQPAAQPAAQWKIAYFSKEAPQNCLLLGAR